MIWSTRDSDGDPPPTTRTGTASTRSRVSRQPRTGCAGRDQGHLPGRWRRRGPGRQAVLLLRTGGDYYIYNYDVESYGVGTCTLAVTEVEDDLGQNDDSAMVILSGDGRGTGRIEMPLGVDWFEVSAEEGDTYRIRVNGSGDEP